MVAEALVDGLTTKPSVLLDVACGTGAASFAALRLGPERIVATDISPAMITVATEKAAELDPESRIAWHAGPAVPMPVEDGSADAVVCASALHFLGMTALADWRRVLRPGGEIAFSISRRPSAAAASGPSDHFAEVMANDFERPADEAEAAALATSAGFEDASARLFSADVGRPRAVFVVHARQPE
jgi:ubiquinone/menaquinone biosynthesis C-methylase UbiE